MLQRTSAPKPSQEREYVNLKKAESFEVWVDKDYKYQGCYDSRNIKKPSKKLVWNLVKISLKQIPPKIRYGFLGNKSLSKLL